MATLRNIACMMLAFALACCLAACSSQAASVPVRDAVNDYSWQELAALSDEIAESASDSAALELAQRYHLAQPDGTLDGSQAKGVTLVDGTTVNAAIIGFKSDMQSDGRPAGITFMFADSVATRGMNNAADAGESDLADTDAIGGWAASDMRRWLNGDFAESLPADLRAVLADVAKSASTVPEFEVGGVDDQGTVDYTADQLLEDSVDQMWLPAVVELSGVSGETLAASERPGWNDVLRGEGAQYQLFANAGVVEDQANAALSRAEAATGTPCAWWLRSVENGSFAYVGEDGAVNREDSEDREYPTGGEPLGVIPCFALAE